MKHRYLRSRGLVLAMVAVLLLGLISTQGCGNTGQSVAGDTLEVKPAVGSLAPDFTLSDLAGNKVRLSDYRGKAVFINFWATWCPPCRAEMPEIEAVYQKYKDEDVVILGVDIRETETTVRSFVENGGYSWIFALDTAGVVSRDYEVTGIPASYFIDKNGVIRAKQIGAMTMRTMESKLAEAMR